MTAIAGLIRLDAAPADAGVLERMQNILAPYGRDAQHHWRQGPAGLVRTLLRTTPQDSLDRQPLQHQDSGMRLVFDGRLDNRDELIRELGLPPAEAALLADSGLALQAILRWDSGAPEHFVGDFALACWQAGEQRLWLARDPLGHRPLFWHRQPGFFAFASLPKALFAIPGVPRAVCEERLADLLALIPMTGPESFYKDIYRVEPGQVVTLQGGQVSSRRYHAFDPKRELHLSSDDDYLEAFREKLEQAVASQLRASGSIASHLSSGFDSSTVTALAARQLQQAGRGQRLTAYTAVPRPGYDGPVPRGRHADESPGARALAARFGNIDHVLIDTQGASILDQLQEDVEALDRAPLNPCNMLWVNAIQADAQRRGHRVLLTGQMGNMTISYTGEEYLPALIGQGRWGRWWHEARSLKRTHPARRWRGLAAQSFAPYLPAWLWAQLEKYRGRNGGLTAYSAIHPGFLHRVGNQRIAQSRWDLSYRPWANGRRMRIAVLHRSDRGEHRLAANLRGLEMRDPTSDLRLLEFCLSVPDHQYLRDGQTRWLLRRLMGRVLPTEILDARGTGLQAADWHESVAAALPEMKDAIRGLMEHGLAGQYLDLGALQADLERWPQTGWARDAVIDTYRLKLLRGLSVGAFIRHVEPDNAAPVGPPIPQAPKPVP